MRLLTASSTTPSHALPCPPPSVSVSPLSLFSCFTICSSRSSTAPQCISPLRSLTLHSSLAAELLSISSPHRWPRGRAFTLKSYSSPCVLQDKSAPAFVAQRVLRNKERFNNFSRLNLSVFFCWEGGNIDWTASFRMNEYGGGSQHIKTQYSWKNERSG